MQCACNTIAHKNLAISWLHYCWSVIAATWGKCVFWHIVTVFLTRLCVCVQFSEYELSKKVTCLTSLTINNSKWCLWVLALWIAGFFIMLHKITYMWLIYEYLWHRLLACALTMCRLYVDLRSRYAFVKFYSSHAAARALEIMKGQLYIGGQCLKVLHCVIV